MRVEIFEEEIIWIGVIDELAQLKGIEDARRMSRVCPVLEFYPFFEKEKNRLLRGIGCDFD